MEYVAINLLSHLSCMCCEIQDDITALHWSAYNGNMAIVQYLVEKCAVITTQDKFGTTPISDAEVQGHTNVADYLKAQVMNMVMGMELNMLPFYTGVRSIIAKYLQK